MNATGDEHSMAMPGDAWLHGGPRARVRMTRAITIDASADLVWAWLAQTGRGAGWHSFDRLDNGGRPSARHLVSWIPPPRLGDATAIGYLRHLEPGRELAWWLPGDSILEASVRSVMAYRVMPEGRRVRLVERFSWDASGPTGWPVLRFFQIVDAIMARRQLANLKRRVEHYGLRSDGVEDVETGARDQYQLYHVIYASGEEAGVPGEEKAAKWRRLVPREGSLLAHGEARPEREPARAHHT